MVREKQPKNERSKNELTTTDMIKTPQSFIHIRHKITLNQYKYWILMLRELRRQLDNNIPPDERGFRSMSLKVFEQAFGYQLSKKLFWNDLVALKNETIAYNFLSKDGEEVKYGSGFITEWKLFATRIEFKLPSFVEEVVEGLAAPKAIFQLLNWEIFNHFSGKYEAIIYKLCRDYRGVKKTPYFSLEKFRDYMGIEVNEYKAFRDFNRFVISAAVKSINQSELSDIRVDVEFEKQGRKVVGLQFLIEQKAQTILPFADPDWSVAFQFAKVPIEPAMQRKYIEMRSEDEIALCIQRANEYGSQQEKKGKEANYGAIYRTAITEGWHTQQQERQEKEEKAAAQRRKTEKVIELQEKAAAEEAREANERISAIVAKFHTISEDRQDEIREDFRATLPIPLRKSFDKQGESAPMLKVSFAEFLVQNNVVRLDESAKPKRAKKQSPAQ